MVRPGHKCQIDLESKIQVAPVPAQTQTEPGAGSQPVCRQGAGASAVRVYVPRVSLPEVKEVKITPYIGDIPKLVPISGGLHTDTARLSCSSSPSVYAACLSSRSERSENNPISQDSSLSVVDCMLADVRSVCSHILVVKEDDSPSSESSYE